MEKLRLSEQQLIDAVCFFHAKFKQVDVTTVEVELGYDDDEGYTADAYIGSEVTHYVTSHFIAAIRNYIDEHLRKDAMSARIMLNIDDHEGMIADLEW